MYQHQVQVAGLGPVAIPALYNAVLSRSSWAKSVREKYITEHGSPREVRLLQLHAPPPTGSVSEDAFPAGT